MKPPGNNDAGNAPASEPALDGSIIICTHNRAKFLNKCLGAIGPQLDQAGGWELVVVANACTDDTVQTVTAVGASQKAAVRMVEEPRPGLALARNVGVASAKGQMLVFLDDDATPTPAWLPAIRGYFADHSAVLAGGGPIELDWGEVPQPDWWQREFDVNLGRLVLDPELEYFPAGQSPFGGNMFIHRRALQATGPFREDLGMSGKRLGLGEESEWFERYRRTGGKLGYVARAIALHWVNPSKVSKRAIRRQAWVGGLADARWQEPPVETRGYLAWLRQGVSALLRGRLSLAEQVYLLRWLGRLRGRRRHYE